MNLHAHIHKEIRLVNMNKKNKYNIYYLITFVIGTLILIYLFYKDPGLFPFSILLDGLVSLTISIVCALIGFIVSYLITLLISTKNKEKTRLLVFIIVYIVTYLIYVLKRFM